MKKAVAGLKHELILVIVKTIMSKSSLKTLTKDGTSAEFKEVRYCFSYINAIQDIMEKKFLNNSK